MELLFSATTTYQLHERGMTRLLRAAAAAATYSSLGNWELGKRTGYVSRENVAVVQMPLSRGGSLIWRKGKEKGERTGRIQKIAHIFFESRQPVWRKFSQGLLLPREKKKGEKTSCVCKLLLLSYLVGYQHNNITTGYRQTHTQGTRTRSLLTRLSSGWLSVARPQANNYHLSCWLVITVNWWEEDDIIIRIRIGAGQQSKRRPLT